MSDDSRWPRASAWFAQEDNGESFDVSLLGVPASRTSISPTHAHLTPNAIREAFARYSTYSWTHGVDIARLTALDAGDLLDPDGPEGESRVMHRANELAARSRLLVALGGDNSITHSVARGVWGDEIASAGLITLDAHHDLRDGVSNGSPVRRLIEAGLSGTRVVQIGIADFSNSPEYAARARELGITVVTRDALRRRPISDVVAEAMGVATSGGGPVHVDLDVDVCDRAFVPACHAAAPGGLTADELRQFAFLLSRSSRVRSIDVTEIDAAADSSDGRTVRLGALLVLEAATALALRT